MQAALGPRPSRLAEADTNNTSASADIAERLQHAIQQQQQRVGSQIFFLFFFLKRKLELLFFFCKEKRFFFLFRSFDRLFLSPLTSVFFSGHKARVSDWLTTLIDFLLLCCLVVSSKDDEASRQARIRSKLQTRHFMWSMRAATTIPLVKEKWKIDHNNSSSRGKELKNVWYRKERRSIISIYRPYIHTLL